MNGNTILISNTGDIKSLMYVVVAFAVSLWLSRKTDRPWLLLPVIFWIFCEPVMEAFYILSPSWLPFDFQPNRILFLYLVGLLSMRLLRGSPKPPYYIQHKPDFTVYLVAYILLVIIAMAVNINFLTVKKLLAIPLEPLTFLLLFIVMRDVITEKALRVILSAIIIMGLTNAMIAVYQTAFDLAFLRTGELRIAFGNIYRATGVFPSEYIFGGFQLIALYVAIVFLEWKPLKIISIIMISFSILLTFHRLDILILITSTIVYLSKYSKKRLGLPMFVLLTLVVGATIPAYTVFQSLGGKSELVSERLSDNTVTGRFKQFGLVIQAMPTYPLGMGSYDHPAYQKLMIENRMTKSVIGPDGVQEAVGLGVHNGFLGVGMQYGILTMLVFMILLWKMVRYFYKRAARAYPITIIPLFAVATWVLANISNGIIIFSSYNILIIALVCGAFVSVYEKGLLDTKADSNRD